MAVWLARRGIDYDSTLLVVIENMLVLVPFMLVTQAVLIGRPLAVMLCAGGAGVVLARVVFLRRLMPKLNLPVGLLRIGAVLLLANLALPFVYRPVMELDVANWEEPSRLLWLYALPALQALGHTWRPVGSWSGPAQGRNWLGLLVFNLWTAGSAVHLWCVGYVSNLPFKPYLAAPMLWVAAWTFCVHLPRCLPQPR